ncbi:MAG: hypothetical protein PF545_07615 [Elusimicrobia bacterium]|jgi:3-deoxy-D-manno-octulosonic-acid transferase|nr:hypothetical protein [Elusimicrobiota bacterium]
MIYIYQILLFFFALIMFLPVLIALFFSSSIRKGLPERFTLYGKELKNKLKAVDRAVWVHAASVGEVKILKKLPGFPWKNTVITTTNITGRDLAAKIFPDTPSLLMPLDFIVLLKRFQSLISPVKLIVLETELWPAFIYVNRMNKPVLLNGRLSEDKFKFYYSVRKIFIKILNKMEKIFPKDRENFLRFKKIGVSESRLQPPLNFKFAATRPAVNNSDLRYSSHAAPIIICGSTHTGEEEILVEIYKKLRSSYNNLTMLISPRHLKRVEKIKLLLKDKGVDFKMWSKITENIPERTVVIIDTMGELSKIYSIADIAFMGGSLVPVGGHNIIEAALWEVPAVTGKYIDNFKSVYNIFEKGGGVSIAGSEKELYEIFYDLLSDKKRAERIGKKSAGIIREQQNNINDRFKEISREIF